MSQIIPVAPAKNNGEDKDQEVLSELEQTLGADLTPAEADGGGKVELDRADLPVFDTLIPTKEEGHPADMDIPEGLHPAALESGDLHDRARAEDTEAGPGRREAENKARGKQRILIAAGGFVLLVLLGVGLWLLMAPAEPEQIQQPVVVVDMPSAFEATRQDLTPFIIPLSNKSTQDRLLRVVVMLELSDPEVLDSLNQNLLLVRDVVYLSMRDKTAEELNLGRNQNSLQEKIKNEINQNLGKAIVSQVYFKEFLISG